MLGQMSRSQRKKQQAELPSIPDKIYFTIGEASKLCVLEQHVLRYWEQEFSQLKPVKRQGNRRYYQRKDILFIRKIKHLLYNEGFTIEGARSKLTAEESPLPINRYNHEFLRTIITSLENLLVELGAEG